MSHDMWHAYGISQVWIVGESLDEQEHEMPFNEHILSVGRFKQLRVFYSPVVWWYANT